MSGRYEIYPYSTQHCLPLDVWTHGLRFQPEVRAQQNLPDDQAGLHQRQRLLRHLSGSLPGQKVLPVLFAVAIGMDFVACSQMPDKLAL